MMQIAVEIQRVLSSHPERIKLQDKRLKFAKPKRATTEVDTELNWQKWVSAVGPDVTVIEVDAATYDPHKPFNVEKYLGS